MKMIELSRFHKQKFLIGCTLMALGVFMPLLIPVENFDIYGNLIEAIHTQNSIPLLYAGLKMVALNSLRSLPHYLGAFIMVESITFTHNNRQVLLLKSVAVPSRKESLKMNQHPLTILAIDDEEEIRFALKAIFEFQNWKSLGAAHVREGLKIVQSKHPDIVLVDYHMPEINGIEGVRMIRKIDPNVPIIVFTIDESQEVADRFLEAGATDFALKPIKAPDIISRIKLHLKLMQTTRLPDLTVKGIGAPTLNLINTCLQQANDYLTANEIAEATGLAYQTTYRYLQHLVAEGTIESRSAYGKVGRPKQSFRIKS